MRLVNITPHEVRLLPRDGEEVTIPPSGIVARIGTIPCRRVGMVKIDGRKIPVLETRLAEREGLPEPANWTRYIVSSLVQQDACAGGRHDTLVPYDLVRDKQGRIVGARALEACCWKAHV